MKQTDRSYFLTTGFPELFLALQSEKVEIGNAVFYMPTTASLEEGFVFCISQETVLVKNAFHPSVFLRACEASKGVQVFLTFSHRDSFRFFILLSCVIQILCLAALFSGIASLNTSTIPIIFGGLVCILVSEMVYRIECHRFLQEFLRLFAEKTVN